MSANKNQAVKNWLPDQVFGGADTTTLSTPLGEMNVRSLRTPHGRTLNCRVAQNVVSIDDADQPEYYFNAVADNALPSHIEEAHGVGRVLFLGIRSKVGDVYHPDLYAGVMLEHTIRYLDRQAGRGEQVPLKYVRNYWSPLDEDGATNYHMFIEALGDIAEPTPEQLRTAAFATWTGQQVLRHGFLEVADIRREDLASPAISVYFNRPYVGTTLPSVAALGPEVI